MSKLSVLNTKGEKVKDITLSKEIWGIEPNDAVLYDAITLSRISLILATISLADFKSNVKNSVVFLIKSSHITARPLRRPSEL